MEELASGWWCPSCESWEEEEDVMEDQEDSHCRACGCDVGSHIKAKVVKV